MNTTSTYTYRRKYRSASLMLALRNMLVAEKICLVDRSDAKYIDSPYSSQPTTVVQAIVGTYAAAAWTMSDDLLTVNEELIVAEHIYDFEKVLTAFDIFANRMDEQNYSVAAAIDGVVLNELLEAGTGAYTTPGGGFTTAANVGVIISNCLGLVAGYADAMKGTYLVVENTDLPGILQYESTSGFKFADTALNNGFVKNIMGVDIYVVRTGTFTDTTYAGSSVTVTNSGHRLFGVYDMSTYASPRDMSYTEKPVAAKTGMETVTVAYLGFKAWTPKLGLTVDITLA